MKWMLFSPEIYYFLVALYFLFLSMRGRPNPGRDHFFAFCSASVGVVVCLAAVRLEGTFFSDVYRVDLFSQIFKSLLSMGLFLVISICSELKGVRENYEREFYFLLLVCTLAMMMLVSSVHLLSIYVSLELSSYSLYILVALRRDWNLGVEAGIKYFLVGIFASAVMLFGIVLLYSTTGSMYVSELIQVLPQFGDSPAVKIGLLLTLSGFFFKLAVFPFHSWAPDVYQGAANQAAAYISTVSKVAAVAILLRMISTAGEGSSYLVRVLVVLSIISMTAGNLAAIVQQDLKRLLAYSTIAHAGYVLIGLLSMNTDGYAGAIFYALALLMMKFTIFLVVIKVAYDGSNLQVEQLAGLHKRSPLLAAALMVALFSLAGLPPFVGFTGKFLIFTAAMEKGYFALVLIAMINVLISLYYYLLVLKAAYLVEPEEPVADLILSRPIKLLTGTLICAMVAAGIFPRYLIDIAKAAVQVIM